jgi:hypothetical protein
MSLQIHFWEGGESSVLDRPPSPDVQSTEVMEKLGAQGQAIPGGILPAMKLHQRLDSAGVYERLEQFDPRRRRMLQTYLTTPKSAGVIGKEEGIQTRQQANQLIRSTFDIAFFALPEDQRAEYGNDPNVAWQTSAAQKTHTKGETIKEALDERRNPDTEKIEFSDTHIAHLSEAATKRWEREREAQRAAQSENTSGNVSPTQFTTSGRRILKPSSSSDKPKPMFRKIGEEWMQEKQPEDQPSEEPDPPGR